MLIYNRFKNSRVVSAEWMSTMMRCYVLSKMSYLAEIWTDATKKRLLPLAALYNRATLSEPTSFNCMMEEWQAWEAWVESKKAWFTRLLHTPETNILSTMIKTLYWNEWMRRRHDDHFAPLKYIKDKEDPQLSVLVNGFDPELSLEPRMQERLSAEDDAFEPTAYVKARKRATIMGPIMKPFMCCKKARTSDGLIGFEKIPSRVSFKQQMLALPSRVTFYDCSDDDGERISFSDD